MRSILIIAYIKSIPTVVISMTNGKYILNTMGLEKLATEVSLEQKRNVQRFKNRMLQYANPVEFVNNMYGCHPGDVGGDYFQTVFGE